MGKILLLGGSGYVGSAFATVLRERQIEFVAPRRHELDYTRFETLLKLLKDTRPEFLVNAAGYTGKPNVDACENAKADTLQGNTLFPQTVAHACMISGVPWGHVSSGCIYSGAKLVREGREIVEKDLSHPDMRDFVDKNPSLVHGYSEEDEPNFTFRNGPCSFYSGTKALGEEAISGIGQSYVWRLRIPFDGVENPRNYLTKVQRYAKVYDNFNSISHREDFASACLDLWKMRAPFGTYNVTNPGFISARRVIGWIEEILKPDRKFEFWDSDETFYKVAAKTPRSNCVMDVSKLLAAGVRIRPVEEAVVDSLKNWVPAGKGNAS